VVAGLLGLPGAGAGTAGAKAPAPVSPVEALRLTQELAKQAPPLPPELRALLDARAPKAVHTPAHVQAEAARIIAEHAAGRWVPQRGPGHDEHERNGRGCEAQGFKPDGTPTVHEKDLNRNRKIDPWEQDPNKNETCLTLATIPYDNADWSKGSFQLEKRTELDPETKKTYLRHALRWNYVVEDAHGSHAPCIASEKEGKVALKLIKATRDALEKYTNNPALLKADGYWPYPVPNTKTFHWVDYPIPVVNPGPADRNGPVLDPNDVEMFTMALTDDGYRAFNVAYIYDYDGDSRGGPEPYEYDANKHRLGNNNKGAGCLINWHGHNGQADGAATGNLEGRIWMAHLQFYGGVTQFDQEEEWDAAEPHGWFTPLQNVPAGASSHGTGA
jgi:hypothetical protein